MKAMVLAAGLGLRMRPLSLLRPKPIFPVLNRPLIHWTLELLALHGVTEVVINLHHRASSVRRAVGDGRAFGLRVAWSHERTILGTGGGPRKVRRFFGDEPFLLVNGDVAFDFDLTALVRRHRASGARATLALKPNPDPRRYGPVVTGPGGWVRSLAGRPRRALGTVSLFTGIHVVDPALLDRLPPGASDCVRQLYAPLVEQGERILGVRVRGAWYDLGSPSLYLASQLSMLASGFRGTRPCRSLVAPEARVARGARVRRSIVAPGAAIEAGAVVDSSILWERTRVGPQARVRRCLLAEGARLAAGEEVERVLVVPSVRIGGRHRGRRRGGQVYVEIAS